MAGWLDALLPRIVGVIPLPSVGLDGPCGTSNALQMARQSQLQLLSTLRDAAAWSCPDTGS